MQCYIHCMFDKVGLVTHCADYAFSVVCLILFLLHQYDEEGNVDMDTISHLVPPDFKAKLDVVTAHCKTIRK